MAAIARPAITTGVIHIDGPALVLSLIPHGEHGLVVRLLTPAHGLVAAYVRGGRGRRLGPVLQPGNLVAAHLLARAEGQLPQASVELLAPRAALATSGAAVAVLDWACSLMAATLAEGDPHPRLYDALDALGALVAAGGDRAQLGSAIVRHELLLLAELGHGLDLASCAATGATTDLGFVSPKSRQAVSRGAGLPYAAKLLPLPGFLVTDAAADAQAIADGLALTGHFIARDLLGARADRLWPTRQVMVQRLTV